MKNERWLIDRKAAAQKWTEKGKTMSQYELIQHRGKSLMFWALEWFRMSNDCFYSLYGFNFNPHNYPGLYEMARERVYGERKDHD